MSEPINNEFNNNSQNFSDSDMQNVNNSEVEIQQTTNDDSSETDADNSQVNAQEPSHSADSGIEDEARADADSDEVLSDNQADDASGELSSNADNSDDNDDQDDAPNNSAEDIPQDASPADNANSSASESASVQAAVNNSNNNANLFEEEIQRKIDAVKDFAFCHRGDDKVPVFPYVVALTGHRDAIITDAVKESAKNQLRSLAKAWGSASSNCFNALLNQTVYTRQYIQNNTVPLIALIGLEDEESGKIWSEIAADLRDNEHFNIKIVAVASIPFQTLFELAEKYPNRFSRPENKIDFNLIDGLIELPAGNEFEYLLEDYKLLESFCTDEKPHTKELFNMLLSNSHIYEMQFEEYRKFMCIHSHALFAFVNNIEQIQKQWNDIYSEDLDSFTSVEGNNIISEKKRQKLDKIQHELSKYEDEVKDAYRLKDLIYQVYKIRQQGNDSANYEDLKNEFERLANEYQNDKESNQDGSQAEDDFSRTEEMIVYKLLGNIKAKLNPYEIPHGISFASIGPVVCIHTENKRTSNNCQSDKADDKSCGDITIIVKDQPDDEEYTLTKSIPHFQNIVKYSEIREVFKKAGLVNRACLNNFKRFSYYNDYNSTTDQSDLRNVIDKNTDSLFRFCQYARLLKSHYFKAMKITTFAYAIIAFVLLFGIALFSAYINMDSLNAVSAPTFITIIPSILALILIVCQITYSLLNYHKLYHYFHALFVGIKVQLYWDLAGVDANVPEMFSLHQINETVWLRAAFNGLFVTVRDEKKPDILSDDNSDDPELQLKDYIDFHTKQLHKCTTIRENWVDSEFDDLIGINQDSLDKLKQSLENELDELSGDLESKTPAFSVDYIWGQIKNVLNWLSPFGGQLACFIYLFPFIYFPIKNYLLKNQCFTDWNECISSCCQSAFVKALLTICFVALTLLSCLLIVYNAYRKASLKDLDIKRKHQLLYPFRRANLLLSIKLAHWKSALSVLQKLIRESNRRDLHLSQQSSTDSLYKYSHSHIINNSYRDYKVVLKELGKIKLAVCAEWYLGLKERRMNIQYNRTILR